MNNKKPLMKELFITSVVVAALHIFALETSLYWTADWFDIFMHFLGGFVIGLIALVMFFTTHFFSFPRESRFLMLYVVLSLVLLVGLGWELWEMFAGLADPFEDVYDSLLDVVMDVIGGGVAFMYGKKKLPKYL